MEVLFIVFISSSCMEVYGGDGAWVVDIVGAEHRAGGCGGAAASERQQVVDNTLKVGL